jgi:uncharacterized protein DUF1569
VKSIQSILNKQLWHSFVALVGYALKYLTVPRIKGRSFFTQHKYLELIKRIENLKEGASSNWGSMRVEQMLHHLNLSMGSGQGFYALPDESYLLSRTIIKWIVIDLYSEQPKGLRLPLSMAIPVEARFSFDQEKKQLLQILKSANKAITNQQWRPHCYFGKLTANQWGKLCLIHVDYHLRQFSA